jgi:hypothetical protein
MSVQEIAFIALWTSGQESSVTGPEAVPASQETKKAHPAEA